jgi:hypothetical protein
MIFPRRLRPAIREVSYVAAFKIGWESRRFWEQDAIIYGEISWLGTDQSRKFDACQPLVSERWALIGEGNPCGWRWHRIRGFWITSRNRGQIRCFAGSGGEAASGAWQGTDQTDLRFVVENSVQPGIVGACRSILRKTIPATPATGWTDLFCRRFLQSPDGVAGGSCACSSASSENDCRTSGYAMSCEK